MTTDQAALAARLRTAAVQTLPFGRARLKEYTFAESPTGDLVALRRCADLVAAAHAQLGGRTERIASMAGEHLVSRWGGEDPGGHLVVIGHYDTVWPVGQLEQMPYADDGETIAGPGTYDMKAGLVVLEMALRAMQDAGIAPAIPIRAVLVADEEVGSPDGRAVVEAHLEGAVAVIGLEPPHPDGALKIGRLGSTRLRLRVRGREAHAALDPEKGVSAIDELLDQLAAIRAAVPTDGTALLNVGTIAGGTRTNVIAGDAEAHLGLRFASPEVESSVLAAIARLECRRAGAVLEADVLTARPTWAARPADPFLERVAALGGLLGQQISGRPATGAGDTNFAGARGLPTLDGFGPTGRGAHAADESVLVRSLADRAALLATSLAIGFPTALVQHDVNQRRRT
jgi:glutamate carboxypeptidase